MLSDPLYLGVPPSVGSPATAVNTEVSTVIAMHLLPGLGSTKRKGQLTNTFAYNGTDDIENDVVLTTGHISSKENAPYATDRLLQRLDVSAVDANGKSVTLSAAMTIAVPNGVFNEADPLTLARMLALLVLYGPSTSTSDYAGTVSDTTLKRLLDGEA